MEAYEISISRAKPGLGYPTIWRVIKKAAQTALQVEQAEQPGYVSVMLTDNEGIHAYNRDFRHVDAPTDVLSFPMGERDIETGAYCFGDMMISLERAAAQAEEYGNTVEHEVAYLTVHSVLHLLGYDHVDEGEMKKEMRAHEKAIMAVLAL